LTADNFFQYFLTNFYHYPDKFVHDWLGLSGSHNIVLYIISAKYKH